MDKNLVLSIKDLKIGLVDNGKKTTSIDNISFNLEKGKVVGIIGESGSGKSLTCSAILGLLNNKKWIVEGDILFRSETVPYNDNKQMKKFRGKHIGLITQNPMSAFNPTMTIKKHFMETILSHKKVSKSEIEEIAINILEKMQIQNPKDVLNSYSFQLSGGMLQRIMIAIAISLEPEVLIADEPTTALDLTVQYEIIKILSKMQSDLDTAIILVSHDLRVISDLADDVIVMYGGSIVEEGSVEEILNNPKHPYTKGLLASRPSFTKERLTALEGVPISIFERDKGCPFYNRCNMKSKICKTDYIYSFEVGESHKVRCINVEGEIQSYGIS